MYGEEGEILTNNEAKRTKWETDFASLFTSTEKNGDNLAFKEEITECNRESEEGMLFEHTRDYIIPFKDDEVRKVVVGATSNQALGYDNLVYDVLKNNISINVLTSLFTACLNSGLIPTTWLKAVITLSRKVPSVIPGSH